MGLASPPEGGSEMPGPRKPFPAWIRFSSLGVEFVAAVAGLALVGHWIDGHYLTAPWGLLAGACLGIAAGMLNLIRQTLPLSRELSDKNKPGRRRDP